MANPFKVKGSIECSSCADEIENGDYCYYHEDEPYCEWCAEEQEIVCACGDYKKPEYDECYDCFNTF